MSTLRMKPGSLGLLLLTVGVFMAFTEYGGLVESRGALLMTLVFWTTLIQGCVAVVAIAELTRAQWIASLKQELLSAYPLLLLVAAMFLLLWPQLDLYPWAAEPGGWLNRPFFLIRNLALLLPAYVAARLFARRSMRGDGNKEAFAVAYLFVFVGSQTLVAFDWVMSLEYPWYSTLFGAYFFVESVYAGLALAGVLFLLFSGRKAVENPDAWQGHLRDLGSLLFGFSVLWAGLFFAQYLLVWYGNLPEEAKFIVERLSSSPFRELSWFFLVANFLVPFVVLTSRWAKGNVRVIFAVSVVILLGLFGERLLFILPVVPLHVGILLLQNFLILLVWLLVMHSRELLLPAAGGDGVADEGGGR